MDDPMVWADELIWLEIPVNEDGGEDYPASKSPVRAHVGWQVTPSRAVPVAVVLRRTDGEAVSPALWRRLKSSEVIAASRNLLEATGHLAELLSGDPEQLEAGRRLLDTLAERPPSTRYGPEHYARVASIYTTAVAAADTQPVQTVRREMRADFPDLSVTTVKGWIRTARKRGLITTRARSSRAFRKGGEHA